MFWRARPGGSVLPFSCPAYPAPSVAIDPVEGLGVVGHPVPRLAFLLLCFGFLHVALPQRCACRDGRDADGRQSQDTSATDLWIWPSIHIDGLARKRFLQRPPCGVPPP